MKTGTAPLRQLLRGLRDRVTDAATMLADDDGLTRITCQVAPAALGPNVDRSRPVEFFLTRSHHIEVRQGNALLYRGDLSAYWSAADRGR